MVYLAGRGERRLALRGHIAQDVAAGLVISARGAGGGFALARPAEEISLLGIIEAVEGPILMNRCLMREGACGRETICTATRSGREFRKRCARSWQASP